MESYHYLFAGSYYLTNEAIIERNDVDENSNDLPHYQLLVQH